MGRGRRIKGSSASPHTVGSHTSKDTHTARMFITQITEPPRAWQGAKQSKSRSTSGKKNKKKDKKHKKEKEGRRSDRRTKTRSKTRSPTKEKKEASEESSEEETVIRIKTVKKKSKYNQ